MKKILFLVLLTIAFCSAVEEFKKEDLEILLNAITWDDVKNNVEEAVEWLKSNGLWEPLKRLLMQISEYAAMQLCQKAFSQDTCQNIISFVKQYI